jgi:hypothetical protein
MGFGFIDHSEVVTATKYNTLADSHTPDHSTLNLLSVLSLVFITALNNGYSSAVFSLSDSWQRIYQSHYSTCKVFKSHTKSFWLNLILSTADSMNSDL